MNLFAKRNSLQSKIACILVLIILPTIVYFNSLQGAFQFDDRNLLNKEWIADLNSFNESVSMKSFQNRPVLLWTFAINNHLDNKHTFGFHLVNLTIHILVTVLIFIILVRIKNIISKENISGKKENGKEACIYEKGKELGGDYAKSYPDWVRVELRYGSKDRIIPFDVLLNPGQYLSAGYPAFSFISEKQCKVKTAKAKGKVVYEKAKEVLKQQFGGLLWVMFCLGEDFSSIVREVVPSRLIPPDFENRQIKDMEFPVLTEEQALNMAFA